MNLEQARGLLGQYVKFEIKPDDSRYSIGPFYYPTEGKVAEVVLHECGSEGIRIGYDGSIIPLNKIAKWLIYSPGEWQE